MGRIDKELAIEMRRQGMTYKQIGEHFGVSWQTVHFQITHCDRARKGGNYIEKIPYKGLYDFLIKHDRVSISQLAMVVFKSQNKAATERMRNLCNGGGAHVSKKGIDRLLAYTGMTYEKLFELREGFKEENDDVQGAD